MGLGASGDLPSVGAVLSGPHWPGRVRVVRIEPRGVARVLIEAVTLDDADGYTRLRLISRLLKREDLTGLEVAAEPGRATLMGDPTGFRLAAEATRIRLAHTHDPQLAVQSSQEIQLLNAGHVDERGSIAHDAHTRPNSFRVIRSCS